MRLLGKPGDAGNVARAFLIYSDALKKGEEERMNLELRCNGCEATAKQANSGNE
jgi:hypothetical protein